MTAPDDAPSGFKDYTYGVIKLPEGGSLCAACVRIGVSLFAELWRSRMQNENPDPPDDDVVISVSFKNPNWSVGDSPETA